jgi:hypothetical protein
MRTFPATLYDRPSGAAGDVRSAGVSAEHGGDYTAGRGDADAAVARPSVVSAAGRRLTALLGELARTEVDQLDGHDAVDLLDTLHDLDGPLAAARARLLQAISAADVPRENGAANAAAWLRHRYGMHGGQAKTYAERARLLRFLPQTSERLASGRLSPRQADVLVDAAKSKSYRDSADVEDSLLPLADGADDTTFARRVKDETARRDVDAIDKDQRAAFERRELRLVRHRDGMLGIDARLHPTAGAEFEAALSAMTTPDPVDTPDEARRTLEQRRADAFCDLVDAAVRAGMPPSAGGVQPQVHVHVDYDDVAERAGRNPLDDDTDPDHPANTGRTRHPDGTWRTRGTLDGYGPLGPDAMARLLCDADICRIVRRGPSQILDLGQPTKAWPASTRRAIVARDRHCRFPGCDRPPAWCQAHHVQFRHAHDGPTNVTNGVLLCSFHHHLVHEGGWTLTFESRTGVVTVVTPDGGATYTSLTDRDPRGPAPPPGARQRSRPA